MDEETVLWKHLDPGTRPRHATGDVEALWLSSLKVSVGTDCISPPAQMTLNDAGAYLAEVLDGPQKTERVMLTGAEAEVIAELLGELQARLEPQPNVPKMREHLGVMCSDLAARLWTRLGM